MKIKQILIIIAALFIAMTQTGTAEAIQIFKGPKGETYIGDYLPEDLINKGYLSKAEWEKKRRTADIAMPEMGVGRPKEKENEAVQSSDAIKFLSSDKTAVELAFPGASWAVDMKNTQYEVRKHSFDQKYDHTYLAAKNTETQFGYNIYIDKIKGMNQKAAHADCRKLYMDSAKNTIFNKPDVATSVLAGLPIVEYTHTDELDGVSFSRRVMHAYIARAPYCIEVVLTKSAYVSEDRKTFEGLLSAVSVNEQFVPNAYRYALWSDVSAVKANYKEAERFAKLALDTIPKDNMPDNEKKTLEMVYSVVHANFVFENGDPANARKLLNEIAAKYPDFAMSYYALAYINARQDDSSAMYGNLELFYKYKDLTPRGLTLPDPAAEPAFKKYMKEDRFLNLTAEKK